MSDGRSVRNAISVEPGLPKIVVSPCRRMTSKVASRTVGAPAARTAPSPSARTSGTVVVSVIAVILLAVLGPVGAPDRGARDTGRAPIVRCSVLFAYRTDGLMGGRSRQGER